MKSSYAWSLMGDSRELGSDSDARSKMKAILRLTSFALPSLVTIIALLVCWRRHFVKQSIESAGLAIALCVYLAIFLIRRSRGLSARFFYASTGPDSDESSQDQTDIGALWAAAIIVGVSAYTLFEYW